MSGLSPVHARTAMLDGVALDLDAANISTFVHAEQLASTMDHAHQLAAQGAASGTVVVADVQTAGRGRAGKAWVSESGAGLWFTLIERAVPTESLALLSLRAGLTIAEAVTKWCAGDVLLKWPNDVLLRDAGVATLPLRKLAGVLAEARWRDATVDWVAVGIGLNLRAPSSAPALASTACLTSAVSRADALAAIVPGLRAASRGSGMLSDAELAEWHARDAMLGGLAVEPASGVVDGVSRDGSLRLVAADGSVSTYRTGSLVLQPRANDAR